MLALDGLAHEARQFGSAGVGIEFGCGAGTVKASGEILFA